MLFKQLLSKNTDVFLWSPTYMQGIDPEVICRKLSIKADAKSAKQRPRRMNEERTRAISDEVDHLLQVGFIREMFYPNWLFNPVFVKKRTGSGEFASTLQTSMKPARRIVIPS